MLTAANAVQAGWEISLATVVQCQLQDKIRWPEKTIQQLGIRKNIKREPSAGRTSEMLAKLAKLVKQSRTKRLGNTSFIFR